MNRFDRILRSAWSMLIVGAFAFAVAGCEGDTGPAGPAGPAGADGLDGADGADFVFTPLESCGVCHGSDAFVDAEVAHELPPIELVSNVAFAVNGADLDVTFDLTVDNAPGLGYDQVQRGYRIDGVTRTDICNATNGTCALTSLTLTGNPTAGNYTIKVLGGATEAANNNRYLFRVGAGDDRETRVYLFGDFPAAPVGPAAVTAQACTNCHGPEGIGIHGGYFAAGDSGEVCLACHGIGDVPSLAFVTHGVHNSSNHPDGEWVYAEDDPTTPDRDESEIFHVTYPTYMNNCSVCHETDAQLAAANSMALTDANCFTCHYSTEGIPFEEGSSAETFHASIVDGCQNCHAGQITGIPQSVTDVHNGSLTERSGLIWEGEDLSVTEGALINWQINSVADDGTNLTITWQASYNGTGVDPCNATAAAGVPVFFADEDADGDSLGNLSIIRNYAQGEDFILGTRDDRAGQPGGTPAVTNDNTTCAANVATTVVPVETTDATYGRVGIQGKPRLPSPDPDDTDGLMQVRAKSPTFDWVVGVGGAAPPRRNVVDTGLCLNCHRGSLYQHGGNRVDNVDLCMLCHNVAANDEYVRVDEFGVDASESYDGRAGQAFGMKELAHGVHPAGATGNPVVVYRGRGIYGWATSVDQLRNWPSGANCTQADGDTGSNYFTVVGSDDAPADGSDTCQPHNFHAPTFPRGLYDCAACHVEDDPATSVDEGFALLPNPTKAMATTVEAGAPPFGDQTNDALQGVQTTSCVTCHADGATKGHAYQNSWTPQAFPEGRDTIINAVN